MIPEWPEKKVPRITHGLLDLLECVCDALTVLGQGPTCWCGIYPGETVSWEHCGECDNGNCGQAYIRPATAFPYDIFPQQAFDATCANPLAYEIEVGVLRCFPTMDEHGDPPEDETITESALLLLEDQAALHTAIRCCDSPLLEGHLLGAWTPVGPNGGCVGGSWQVYLDPWRQ